MKFSFHLLGLGLFFFFSFKYPQKVIFCIIERQNKTGQNFSSQLCLCLLIYFILKARQRN